MHKHKYRYLELANWELDDAIEAIKQDREWENGQIDEEQIAEAQVNSASASASASVAPTSATSKSRNIARKGTKRLGQLYLKMKGASHRNHHQQHQQHRYYDDQEEKRGDCYDHTTTNTSNTESNNEISYDDTVTTPKVVKVHRKPPAIATNSIVAEDRYNVS